MYHSSEADDYIGTFVYNHNTDVLFDYDQYNSTNTLLDFYPAQNLTNIHKAIKEALNTLEVTHGIGNVVGAELYLMSDGRQTTDPDLFLQVNRARDIGVKIHTFSYGDSDHANMELIASETDGDNFRMSPNNQGLMNMKLTIVKALAKMRGWNTLFSYYGELQAAGQLKDKTPYVEYSFYAPHENKDLKFYVLPEQAGENRQLEYSFELISPSGATFPSPATSLIKDKGRFKGHRVKAPNQGLWKVVIYGDSQVQEASGRQCTIDGFGRKPLFEWSVTKIEQCDLDEPRILWIKG